MQLIVDLTMDDFDRIQKKTPHLADLRPSGKYVMEDLAPNWWCTSCYENAIRGWLSPRRLHDCNW